MTDLMRAGSRDYGAGTQPSLGIRITLLAAAAALTHGCKSRPDSLGSAPKYYGAASNLAELHFESTVLVTAPGIGARSSTILVPGPDNDLALDAATQQAKFAQSAMMRHPETKDAPVSPGGHPKITLLGATRGDSDDQALVRYSQRDRAAASPARFPGGGGNGTISFLLPLAPEAFYDKTMGPPAANGDAVNLCSDPHYPKFMDFFYNWNPYLPACKARIDWQKDLVKVDAARLIRLPSTRRTFPDYWRLFLAPVPEKPGTFAPRTAAQPLLVTFLVGVHEEQKSADLGVVEFGKVVSAFDSLIAAWNRGRRPEDALIKKTRSEKFHQTYEIPVVTKPWFTNKFPVRIEVVSSDQREPEDFVPKAAAGLEESDIFIYLGHSGLGRNFRLGRFEEVLKRPLRMPKDRYQIVYFNGCASWTYYAWQYLEHKAPPGNPEGDGNLRIVAHSLYPDSIAELAGMSMQFFISLVLSKDRPKTWQEIVDQQRPLTAREAFTSIEGDEHDPDTELAATGMIPGG